jgi:predicted transcriptional regulator
MVPTVNDNFLQCRDIICSIFSPESVSLILNSPENPSEGLSSPYIKEFISDKMSDNADCLVDFLILKRDDNKYSLTKFGAVLRSKYLYLLSELNGRRNNLCSDVSSVDIDLLSGYLLSIYDNEDSDQLQRGLIPADAISGSGRDELLYDIYNLVILIIKNPEYFMIHNYEGLPDFAVENIGMLHSAVLIYDPTVDYRQRMDFYHELLRKADHIHGISTWGTGDIGTTMIDCLKSGAEIELVISGELALKLINPPYFNNIDDYRYFENLKFFVTDEIIPVGLTVTDKKLSLGFFLNNKRTYDSIHDFICGSCSCLRWGEELFSYYKERSVDFEEFLRSNGCL